MRTKLPSSPPNAAQKRLQEAALRLFAQLGTDDVSLSQLAQAAGVARGTIYNNSGSTNEVFTEVANQLVSEMHQRVTKSSAGDLDPVHHLANGVRFFIRRAQEEPHWGHFINRFAFKRPALFGLWDGPFMEDLEGAMKAKQYDFQTSQLPTVLAMISGSVLGTMFLVMEGHKAWRDAGSEIAELLLRALGVEARAANRIARLPLPPLLEAGAGEASPLPAKAKKKAVRVKGIRQRKTA